MCFTDSPELLCLTYYGAWKIEPLRFAELDDTRNARWHKTHPHVLFGDSYSESLWVDANISFLDSHIFDTVCKKNRPLVIPRHFKNDCIFQEIDDVKRFVVSHGREDMAVVEKMERFLRQQGMPQHYGLHETNVIFRKHGDGTIAEMMEAWWAFIRDYSKRDQLSLSYVLWQRGMAVEDVAIENARLCPEHVRFYAHRAAIRRGGGV